MFRGSGPLKMHLSTIVIAVFISVSKSYTLVAEQNVLGMRFFAGSIDEFLICCGAGYGGPSEPEPILRNYLLHALIDWSLN